MTKGSVLRLATVFPVLIILCISILSTTAYAAPMPLFISGHVTVNGVETQGVTVNGGSSTATTDASRYYQIWPSLDNGTSVTVTANEGSGHTQSGSVKQ